MGHLAKVTSELRDLADSEFRQKRMVQEKERTLTQQDSDIVSKA